MMRPALRLVEAAPVRDFTPSADRRAVIRYPGGHEVRINREHLARVLAVKAALVEVV